MLSLKNMHITQAQNAIVTSEPGTLTTRRQSPYHNIKKQHQSTPNQHNHQQQHQEQVAQQMVLSTTTNYSLGDDLSQIGMSNMMMDVSESSSAAPSTTSSSSSSSSYVDLTTSTTSSTAAFQAPLMVEKSNKLSRDGLSLNLHPVYDFFTTTSSSSTTTSSIPQLNS